MVELVNTVIVVPEKSFDDRFLEALRIAESFDKKDAPFIALALKLRIPVWTEDKDMLRYSFPIGRYMALDTQAVEELLEGKMLEEVLDMLRGRLGLAPYM